MTAALVFAAALLADIGLAVIVVAQAKAIRRLRASLRAERLASGTDEGVFVFGALAEKDGIFDVEGTP